jgi:Cu+-exporting ATPase
MNTSKSQPPPHSNHRPDPHVSGGHSCCSSDQSPITADESAQPLKDPVCGMVVTAQSPHVFQFEGQPVYFCSAGCKAKFAADPDKYPMTSTGLPNPAASEPVAAGTV